VLKVLYEQLEAPWAAVVAVVAVVGVVMALMMTMFSYLMSLLLTILKIEQSWNQNHCFVARHKLLSPQYSSPWWWC
jgi:hypothetical protein